MARSVRAAALSWTVRGAAPLALSCAAAIACTPAAQPAEVLDVDASFEASAPVGPCAAIAQEHPIEGYDHVDVCSYVHYRTTPPSSGNHYPYWAAYAKYADPVPEGYWVHNLEHGAIVLTYNCGKDGCADDVAAAQQMIDAYPVDPACVGGVSRRLLLTPDPELDVRFAASAWGWTLRANCFDAAAFLTFAQAHYGQGRELVCSDGEYVVGTSGDPAGCGAAPTP